MPSVVNKEKDHPRVCGEHLLELVMKEFCGGSSPRMRGAPAP